MGDSACLMQVQPFSYTAGIPNEAKEGNQVHALGQSVSFGRFMSESLSWEKRSTFSHKKYVEEAERYSKPGSVAQKKAFFEAHYKTLAARKAAALLEQQQAINGDEGIIATKSSEIVNTDSPMADSASVYDDCKENNPNSVAADSVAEEEHVLLENNMMMKKKQSFEKNDAFYKGEIRDLKEVKQDQDKESEVSEGTQMEKPLLKSADTTNQDEFEVTSKRKPQFSSSKASAYARTSRVPSSPAKFTAPIGPNKRNNNLTPMAKKSAMDISNRRRSTPKSSHKSITSTPAKEFNRLTSSIIRKIDGSRIGLNSKASKECPTPLRTPNTASTRGRAKQPLATPLSENKSARTTPVNSSASVSKTTRGKWHFLPTDCPKLMSACRNKSQSPGIFSAFSLRTEERAARRKQRLEEKFNDSQEQKLQQQQQQTTLKEKAETELKKLGQSFCFKARPLPDFYEERRRTTATTKDQMQKPESSPALLGRKSTRSKPTKGKISLLTYQNKSPIKNNCFKRVPEKKKPDFSSFSRSRVESTAHKNTSPDIHHS